MNELLISAISAFQEAWVRPAQLLASRDDLDHTATIRKWMFLVKWDRERDRWMAALHSLIQTALKYPDDGPDVDLDASPNALPSWRQCIESFIANVRLSAEAIEMGLLAEVHNDADLGDEEP
jgi:hypothetical protein